MKRWNCWIGIAVVAMLMVGVSGVAFGSGSTGVRLWYAQHKQSFVNAAGDYTFDGGYAPMGMVQLNGRVSDQVSLVTMIGYGQGWDEDEDLSSLDFDVRRLDALLGVSVRLDYFSLGVGGHGIIVWNELSDPGSDWVQDQFYGYFGPEIFGGVAYPFLNNRLIAKASASVMPVVFFLYEVDDSDDGAGDADGTTFGYSLDIGLIAVFGEFTVGAGYRYHLMNGVDYETEWDDGSKSPERSHEDEFQGPYVSAGWRW